MNTRTVLAALGAVTGLGGVAWADVVSSTFDTGSEGWVTADGSAPDNQSTTGMPFYLDTAGNDGGFVTSPLIWRDEAFFVAPDKFLGDQSDKAGGFVSVDRRFYEPAFGGSVQQVDFDVDLTITGASMTLAADLATVPLLSWDTQTVSFSEAGGWFHLDSGAPASDADIAAVLASLDDIRVRGNLVDEGGRIGMDNFTMVPTPGSVVLFAASGFLARRRR